MYVRSGCAVLWNYRSVKAVRVVRGTADVDGAPQVRVQVSNVYTHTDKDAQDPNAMVALIAAVRLSSAIALADSKNMSPMLQRVMQVSRGLVALTCFMLAQGNFEEQAGLVAPIPALSDGSADRTDGATEYWLSDRAATLFERQRGMSRNSASFGAKFFEYLLTNYTRVLYAGVEASILLLGSICDVNVVTKYANINECNGMELMQNEVEIYDTIRREKREILGLCTPDVLAIWLKPRSDPLLVLDFVGQVVNRNEDGTVRVGEDLVDERDWKQIIDASNRGLCMLARAGLRHYDKTVFNIRAERMINSSTTACEATGEWRVWWIDFGLSEWQDWSPQSVDKWYEEMCLPDPKTHYISGL